MIARVGSSLQQILSDSLGKSNPIPVGQPMATIEGFAARKRVTRLEMTQGSDRNFLSTNRHLDYSVLYGSQRIFRIL